MIRRSIDTEFGLDGTRTFETFGFGPADGRLCVDPGVFAHEFKQARREISMTAPETAFRQPLVRNHGVASVRLIQQPAVRPSI